MVTHSQLVNINTTRPLLGSSFLSAKILQSTVDMMPSPNYIFGPYITKYERVHLKVEDICVTLDSLGFQDPDIEKSLDV